MLKKKILITGAGGMIGPHLIKKLIDNGYLPVVIFRSECSKKRLNILKKKLFNIS